MRRLAASGISGNLAKARDTQQRLNPSRLLSHATPPHAPSLHGSERCGAGETPCTPTIGMSHSGARRTRGQASSALEQGA